MNSDARFAPMSTELVHYTIHGARLRWFIATLRTAGIQPLNAQRDGSGSYIVTLNAEDEEHADELINQMAGAHSGRPRRWRLMRLGTWGLVGLGVFCTGWLLYLAPILAIATGPVWLLLILWPLIGAAFGLIRSAEGHAQSAGIMGYRRQA